MYKISEKAPNDVREKLSNYPPVIIDILFNRGIKEEAAASEFLNCEYKTSDPFSFEDMAVAVSLLEKAIDGEETIGIYHDFDCDGIPGAASFISFLNEIGHTKFVSHMNNRHGDTRGITKEGVDSLIEKGATVLVTIDLGITSNEGINHAKEKGLSVILTDHHKAGESLPKADAIINPATSKTFTGSPLCGAGCIFKVMQGLIESRNGLLEEGKEKWLLDFVGFSTIVDCVPLIGENRVLAKYGLIVLRKTKRNGFLAFFDSMYKKQMELDEKDLSFSIAPLLNSASRFSRADLVFDLLTAKDFEEAKNIFTEIEDLNKKRKTLSATMNRKAKKILGDKKKPVIVVGSIDWNPPFVSLVAQNICKEMGNTVFAWGRDPKTDAIRGSVRTSTNGDVTSLMEKANIFLEYGGHKGAGGFSIKQEDLPDLEDLLNEKIDDEFLKEEVLVVDGEVSIGDLDKNFLTTLDKLAPFGISNRKPIFKFNNLKVTKVEEFGSKNNHRRYELVDKTGKINCVVFYDSHDFKINDVKDFYGHIEFDDFKKEYILRLI